MSTLKQIPARAATALARVPRAALVAGIVVLLLVATVLSLVGGSQQRTVTAHFDRAVSLFVGSEVRILGVPVGRVTAVVPEGRTVRVEMTYDAEYDVPADAQAVIMTPTLTADRFVQLSPAYTDGRKLADGATIEVEDTATPIELDRIYRSLNDITTALGPNGVNRDGTLNEVLTSGAKFLDGRGTQANKMIVALSKAAKTFGNSSDELFGTVRALDEFSGALAANDAAVGSFMRNLGAVSQQLASEKEELRAVLATLAGILGKVEAFVRDNRQALDANLKNLTRVLRLLASERKTLETVLDVGPSSLGNLAVAFDPVSGTIGSRLGFATGSNDLDGQLCTLVKNGKLPSADLACQVFEALLEPALNQPAAAAGRPAEPGVREVRHGSSPAAADLGELIGGTA
jgi:phospholipid/cholesterol/gamma-HCH transport system substrate-binding protein